MSLASESATLASTIDWARPESAAERARLDAWRLGVGDALVQFPREALARAAVHDLTLVVWNTHVGAADLPGFLTDLEAGRLTGGDPVADYVLLLQEIHRGDATVPRRIGAAKGAARIEVAPPSGRRADLAAVAKERALHLYYVPSMRNGRESDTDAPEDRGNAILSTRPLSRLRAFELPFERQRRVAIAATVSLPSSASRPAQLEVVSLHLDPRSVVTRPHRSFGAGRARQIEWLLDALALGLEAPAVLGGDFNSWALGRSEAALARMRSRFVQADLPLGTVSVAPGLPMLPLDHVFFELPEAWRPRFSVHRDAYGSDHRPIIGRLGIG